MNECELIREKGNLKLTYDFNRKTYYLFYWSNGQALWNSDYVMCGMLSDGVMYCAKPTTSKHYANKLFRNELKDPSYKI